MMESAVAREVLKCLRETYRRPMPIDLNMNLSSTLVSTRWRVAGASLEQALDIDFR